jgi:hypothetical protein
VNPAERADRLEELLAEAIPDGTFGGPRDTPPAPRRAPPPISPARAAAHLAELTAAVHPRRRTTTTPAPAPHPRHLHAVPATDPPRKAS